MSSDESIWRIKTPSATMPEYVVELNAGDDDESE